MTVRPTMQSFLIPRVRTLINDTLPSGSGQIFDDQTIQDVLDESRLDLRLQLLKQSPSFVNGTLSYLDYYAPPGMGNLEDDLTLWQYLYTQVTPSAIEPIMGHFTFAVSTLPDIYITGKSYDIYRAAADLLERWSAKLATQFDFSSDGQSFRASQAHGQLLDLALHYRQKQRARMIVARRDDLAAGQSTAGNGGPVALDFFSSGDPGR